MIAALPATDRESRQHQQRRQRRGESHLTRPSEHVAHSCGQHVDNWPLQGVVLCTAMSMTVVVLRTGGGRPAEGPVQRQWTRRGRRVDDTVASGHAPRNYIGARGCLWTATGCLHSSVRNPEPRLRRDGSLLSPVSTPPTTMTNSSIGRSFFLRGWGQPPRLVTSTSAHPARMPRRWSRRPKHTHVIRRPGSHRRAELDAAVHTGGPAIATTRDVHPGSSAEQESSPP